jgi:hypothetical protein
MVASPVVEHKHDTPKDDIVVLSTGIRARIVPVAASLIDSVANRLKPPKMPTFYNEEKGREEENPNHPDYMAALADYAQVRGQAVMDVMVMFGLELVDGVPEDKLWLRRLRFLEKRGQLDLSGYDLDDDFDLEFVYKKFIATGTEDLAAIGRRAGLNKEAIEEAAQSFPG